MRKLYPPWKIEREKRDQLVREQIRVEVPLPVERGHENGVHEDHNPRGVIVIDVFGNGI